MKKIIKLLLLAALAWPSIAAAQGQTTQQQLQHVDEYVAPAERFAATDLTNAARPQSSNLKKKQLVETPKNAAPAASAGRKEITGSVKRVPSRPNKVVSSEYDPVTVADGSVTSTYVPCWGDYYSTKNSYAQMIYPSSMLAKLKDKMIYAIRFYAPDGINFSTTSGDGKLTAYIKNTTNSSFSGQTYYSVSDAKSATVTPIKGDTELTFVFDEGLNYTGGNLLVDVTTTTAGTSGSTAFVGASQSGYTSFVYASSSDYGSVKFLPKMQVWYKDAIEATPSHLDFGTVTCGAESSAQTVTITNNNTQAMTATWDFTGPQNKSFVTTETGESVTLAPGDSKTFSIVCKPGNTSGNLSANFNVYFGENTMCRVALSGKGVKDFEASVNPSSIDFGEVLIGQDGTGNVTLTNTGLQSISPLASIDNGVFAVSATGTGALARGETRDYTITFTPTAEEEATGTLTIKDESGINLRVSLKGKGVNTAAPYVVEDVGGSTSTFDKVVCDGTMTTGALPIVASYLDYGTHSQSLYPAATLGLQDGDVIQSITFYSNLALTHDSSSGSTGYGGSEVDPITVKLGETGVETLNNEGFIAPELTTVCSQSLWSGNKSVTLTFTNPYTYRGGNLVVDMSCQVANGYWQNLNWYGIATSDNADDGTGSGYYMYYDEDGTVKEAVVDFLPKMTMSVKRTTEAQTVRAEVVDWGAQNADKFYSKEVTICNPNSEAVNATLTTTEQFYFADNTDATSKTASLPAGNSPLTLYFNPTAAAAYTGSLIITVDGHSSSTRLTGVGLKEGELAIRDSSFFAALPPYTWTDDNGKTHSSNLTEVATEPNQIIAFLREIYTNKSIPGNYKRGYTTSGGNEQYGDVLYSGVGKITHTGTNYTTGYSWSDDYGWGIEGDIITDRFDLNTSNSEYDYAYYAYMNPTQYKPDQEGVTLLLVEMLDNYDAYKDDEVIYFNNGSWSYHDFESDSKENLRSYISHSIKSVRLVTDSKRTGDKSGFTSGTLFKIDADKLNKFMLLAKGQMRWIHDSDHASYTKDTQYSYDNSPDLDFCPYPCYIYNKHLGDGDVTMNGFNNKLAMPVFYNMFEQFSPVTQNSSGSANDLYASLVNMETFNVEHDCMTVPYRYHQFQMYGEDSEAADCQDVRDLMFFVPDYRMLYHNNRDAARDPEYQKFFNYNPTHAPKMGLYVIHQDAVQGQQVSGKDLYDLTLTWKSNMDEFLPRDQQEYQLYQLITDEFGDEHWEPVYYRNANGEYTDANGIVVGEDNKVPITLSREALTSTTARHTYDKVYIDQKPSGQTVTFAVRGQDADHFLSLQMSNEESFFIPGTDPTELLHTTSATYYSRFEPQEVRNCYSNKIQVEASPNSIRTDYFADGTEFVINRIWHEQVDGTTVSHPVRVATARVTDQKNYVTITVDADTQSPESMFPKGKSDGAGGVAAGYHANPETYKVPISYNEYSSNWYANFDFVVWDNFVADVSNNEHPGQYVYEVVFTANTTIANASTTQGHSNRFSVPVYKTDSRISAPRTLAEVLGDTQMNTDYSPGDVAFDTQVRYSSKQNILRYDAYRWNEGEDRYIVDQVYSSDDEQDLPPTGIAGNQGESYSVTMNAIGSDDYYVGSAVPVNTTNTTNWATFVDYYPTNAETEAGAYVYAPVVELFTRGKKADDASANREDYNTYGGPLQNTAVGKLAVKAHQPSSADQGGANALMSNYWWMGDGTTGVAGEKYSYYNITLDYEALDVPEGYELYKVRAWRKVDKSVLGEILPTRREVRIGQIDADGWYLFEDMNYGDALNEEGTMTMALDRLYDRDGRDGQKTLSRLGARSARIDRPINPDGTGGGAMFGTETTVTGQTEEEAVTGELRATFGARRLDLNGEDNDFSRLDAQFKVRAYFTRKSNPLIASKSGYEPIYVVGNNGTAWDNSAALATLYTSDGKTFTGNLTLPNAGSGKGYFSFATSLPAAGANRFGGEAPDNQNKVVTEGDFNQPLALKYWGDASRAFEMPAGTYNLTVKLTPSSQSTNYDAGTLTVTKGALRAPRRAGETAMTGSDYDYYIAEGECEFHQDGGSGVVTGIDGVKADLNREVESVNYVNTMGQVSNRPWQGVNVVVTRYTDGTTKTTKAVY